MKPVIVRGRTVTNFQATSLYINEIRLPKEVEDVSVELKVALSQCGNIRPLMSKKEYEILAAYLRPTDSMLDFSSARTSCVWSSFVKDIITIEQSEFRSGYLKKMLRSNHKVYAVPRNKGFARDKISTRRSPSSLDAYSDYVMFAQSLGKKFDVVLIDGRARPQIAFHVIPLLLPGGIVILHDYDSKHPYHGYYRIVERWYTKLGMVNTTAIFKPKDTVLYELKTTGKVYPGHLPDWWFTKQTKYDITNPETIVEKEPYELFPLGLDNPRP